MKLGIECELNSQMASLGSVLNEEILSLDTFKQHSDIPGILVKMSEEYYRSTLEYNFEPIENNDWESIDRIVAFLSTQVTRYGLNLNSSGPSFVGTHIHIFGNKYKRKRRKPIFKALMKFILENINDLEYMSLSRLYEGHQLWARWDFQNSKVWSSHLKSNGMFTLSDDAYNSYSQKTKYGPVIHSAENASTGKPASLEIRFIPNELLFNKKIFKFIKSIEDGDYLKEHIDEVVFLDMVYARMKELSQRGEKNRLIINKNIREIQSLSLNSISPRERIRQGGTNVEPLSQEWIDVAVATGREGDLLEINQFRLLDANGLQYKVNIKENRAILSLRYGPGYENIREYGVKLFNSNRFYIYKGYIVDKLSCIPIPIISAEGVYNAVSRFEGNIDNQDTYSFILGISPFLDADRIGNIDQQLPRRQNPFSLNQEININDTDYERIYERIMGGDRQIPTMYEVSIHSRAE